MNLVEFIQQYGPLFGILAAVATVLGVAFKIYRTDHDRQVRDLREQIDQKNREIDTLKREGYEKFQKLNEGLQEQLELARNAIQELRANHAAAKDAWRSEKAHLERERDRQHDTATALSSELEEAREESHGVNEKIGHAST
jgi:TolA-binding protein